MALDTIDISVSATFFLTCHKGYLEVYTIKMLFEIDQNDYDHNLKSLESHPVLEEVVIVMTFEALIYTSPTAMLGEHEGLFTLNGGNESILNWV